MESIISLKNKVEKATEIAKAKLPIKESLSKIESDATSLLDRMNSDIYIKIPFVGDFSSGKSSLLNSFIGRDILPTNISPETAVAYELYYSEDERLEHYSNGCLKSMTKSLSDIKTFCVNPGDIVNVYVKSDNIRKINEKGIVLVDMPGIDSGIEAHNNAILNYIKEGTIFMMFTDVEQATLRTSSISFIREIKQYGLGVNIFLSKADKKPAEELVKIKNSVEETAKIVLSPDAKVGITSSVDSIYGFKDVVSILEAVDTQSILLDRYQPEVDNFVMSIIAQFELQIKLTLANGADFDKLIEQLNEKKLSAIASLEAKSSEAQSLDGSVDDILQDVREALMANSQRLATVAFSSNGDTNTFEAEIMSVIRPVLIESFRREMTEYQETIGQSVHQLSIDLGSILNEKSKRENLVKDLLEKIGGGIVLEKMLQKGLAVLIAKFAGKKALVLILRGLSPIISILLTFLPDIISILFGKSNEQKIAEIRDKIESQIISQIVDKMRENVEQILSETRQEAYNEIQTKIEETIKQIDDNINAIQSQKESSEAEIQEKVDFLTSAIEELKVA